MLCVLKDSQTLFTLYCLSFSFVGGVSNMYRSLYFFQRPKNKILAACNIFYAMAWYVILTFSSYWKLFSVNSDMNFHDLFMLTAFSVMISLAVNQLIEKGPKGQPDVANIMGLPALLGASVYSFMCHHSLPGLIAPISGNSHIKRYAWAYFGMICWMYFTDLSVVFHLFCISIGLESRLTYLIPQGMLSLYGNEKLLNILFNILHFRFLAVDYVLIASFYLLLALTGVFAFPHLDELYTLVFNPRCSASSIEDSLLMRIIGYFLALFPVFTLSTSFPIIAITLRNNLQNAIFGSNLASYPWAVQHLLFPTLSVVSSLKWIEALLSNGNQSHM